MTCTNRTDYSPTILSHVHTTRKIACVARGARGAVCCLQHIHLVGTNVRLPNIRRIPPDVDFKTESWNNPNRQCCARLSFSPCRTKFGTIFEISTQENSFRQYRKQEHHSTSFLSIWMNSLDGYFTRLDRACGFDA